MTHLDPVDLDALDKIANAATPGPWKVEYFGDSRYPQRICNDAAIIVADTHWGGGGLAPDAEFIAAARTALPALIAEVRKLRFQLGEARQRIKGFESVEEAVCHHIPEHYEAGYNAIEDWTRDAAHVVAEAQNWRKRGRSDELGDRLDAAVEKIYPSEDYL